MGFNFSPYGPGFNNVSEDIRRQRKLLVFNECNKLPERNLSLKTRYLNRFEAQIDKRVESVKKRLRNYS